MSHHFGRAISQVLKHEGGYVPAAAGDPGGETNFGISQRAFPNVNIRELTKSDAVAIYREHYWGPLRCDELPRRIAAKVLDVGVNVGVSQGQKLLQESVNYLGGNLKVDGWIGPRTLAGVKVSDPDQLVGALVVVQRGFYERLIARDPAKYGAYALGWRRRACWAPR